MTALRAITLLVLVGATSARQTRNMLQLEAPVTSEAPVLTPEVTPLTTPVPEATPATTPAASLDTPALGATQPATPPDSSGVKPPPGVQDSVDTVATLDVAQDVDTSQVATPQGNFIAETSVPG